MAPVFRTPAQVGLPAGLLRDRHGVSAIMIIAALHYARADAVLGKSATCMLKIKQDVRARRSDAKD
jgi:hypothetical protein